jgi:cytoskeletal protein CcmA (bactofilin family)
MNVGLFHGARPVRAANICFMSDAPNRRISDRRGGPPTVIGTGVSFRGDIIAPGAVLLSGSIRGDGDIGGTLSIAREAHWDGQVRARSAVVAGTLTGRIEVTEQLEVGAAGVIRGHVTARTLAIARGAVIEGEIHVTSGAPIVRFEEKRNADEVAAVAG